MGSYLHQTDKGSSNSTAVHLKFRKDASKTLEVNLCHTRIQFRRASTKQKWPESKQYGSRTELGEERIHKYSPSRSIRCSFFVILLVEHELLLSGNDSVLSNWVCLPAQAKRLPTRRCYPKYSREHNHWNQNFRTYHKKKITEVQKRKTPKIRRYKK